MRPLFVRVAAGCGFLAASVALAQPPTQPPTQRPVAPELKKMKDELSNLLQERDKIRQELSIRTAEDAERTRLREEFKKKIESLGDLSQKIMKPEEVPPPPKEVKTPKGPNTDPMNLDEAKVLDPLRVAQNLYKAGDVDAAYRAIKLQKPDTLSPDDRLFAQYLSACCLRRLGKLPEAAAVYREIADGKQDEFITECSLTQLAQIRTTQELEGQLEQLRPKRKLK